MANPLISICIPTRNRTDLLKKLLDSIREQTFKDFEIIINDNSEDESVGLMVRDYKDLPVSYQKNQPSVSAANNFIRIMEKANGEWIKIMHDDDWFAFPNSLQRFADKAIRSGKDFIFSGANEVWLDTGKSRDHLLTADKQLMLDDSVFSLFYLNVIGHPSVVMHRKDPSIKYDPNFRWVVDIDYYVRYLLAHPGYHYIPEKLVNIGKSPSQESHLYLKNINVELPEYFFLLAKYPADLCLKDQYVFHLIWNMLMRYKIKDLKEIYAVGYEGPMPAKIDKIIACQRRIPRFILKQPPWSEKLMKKYFEKLRETPDSRLLTPDS